MHGAVRQKRPTDPNARTGFCIVRVLGPETDHIWPPSQSALVEVNVQRLTGLRMQAGGIVIFSPFADHDATCDNLSMRARRLLNLLIALSVAAGLVSMPVALPAHAHSGPPPMTSSDEMSAMAEDMPCCPHEQKSKDCQDCPLLGFCLIKSTQLGPMAGAVLLDRTSLRAVLPVIDDAITDGLERPPPDHPPRILI